MECGCIINLFSDDGRGVHNTYILIIYVIVVE
jgi:hypothetical protein